MVTRRLPLTSLKRALTAGAALICGAGALAAAQPAMASPTAHHAHPAHPAHPLRGAAYVALGDSYAAAPLVPDQVDAHCLRSSNNYPSLVARSSVGTRLTDVTCSGATTVDMTSPQGTAAPQLDAVNRRTDLVTLTIGGNDIGFSAVLGTCAQLGATDPSGAPCRAYLTGSGTDRVTESIAATGPKVAQVIRGIHRRAPHARIVVVGYPALFPENGVGCTSASVPLAAGDFPYLRDKEKELNSMLARQARLGGATYADTYTPTVGHDLCAPAGTRWIEPFVPQSPAAPLHPNAQGESAMAAAVQRALTHRH
ncbi:SGNH/GDSL hydrolase family protein [Streptomyces sp. NPDC048718]|uniref:SGNH/GDSL hydrolase family protein n=1 Tax=Streptomyces sp. NPDC048718 TaxID=3365587 RepID=UPI00371C9801